MSRLRRETIRLSQIQDLAGCRLVVPDIEAQDVTVSQLLDVVHSPVLMDRRLKPSHGYRAVHLICTVGERNVEIQVRTSLQHFWAQWSEKLADVLGDEVKYGGGESIVATTLRVASDAIALIESHEGRIAKQPAGQDRARLLTDVRAQKDRLVAVGEDMMVALEDLSRRTGGELR